MANSLALLLLCLIGRYINATTVTWVEDVISLDIVTTETTTGTAKSWQSVIDISANGPVYRDNVGQFRLNFMAYDTSTSYFSGSSGCISIADSEHALKMVLLQTNTTIYYMIDGEAEQGDTTPLNELLNINAAKINDLSASLLTQETKFTIEMDALHYTTTNTSIFDLEVTVNKTGCSPMRTEVLNARLSND